MNKTQPFRIFISLLLVLTHLNALADDGLGPNPAGNEPSHGASVDETPNDGVDQPANPFTLPHTFRMIIPTVDESHVAGNGGSLMLNFESTPVDQMDEMIQRARAAGLLPNWESKTPEIIVYVPQDVDTHSRDQIVKDAIRAFEDVYPNSKPTVIVRVDKTDISVKALYTDARNTLAEQRLHTTDPETLRAIDFQISELEQTYVDVKKKLEFTAGQSRRYKGRIAKFRAVLVTATRIGTVFPAMFMGLGPATIALTMGAADGGIELFTATWSQRMQKALSYNPFQMKERVFFPGKKFSFNSNHINAFMSVAINTAWNMLFFVVIRATVLQSLQHAAMPTTYAWPLASALVTTFISNLGPAALNAYFVKGYLTMVNKGWTSSANIDMALQLNAIPDTTNNFANSMPDKIGWVRKYTMSLLIGVFGTVGYLGGKLPRRTNRIVLIHDAINLAEKGNDPVMEQANIEATMNIANDNRDLRFEEVKERIMKLRAIRDGKAAECGSHLDGSDGPKAPDQADAA